MLCYVNHPRKDVEGHWWLKKKPQIADRKNDRKKITLPGQLSSPGKKQREEQPTYSSCLASLLGKSAATQDQALRGSSQLHSVVVALGICCGFVRWWGCTLASQKSHKHNSGKKKKYENSWSYWRSSWHFPSCATISFGISRFCDQKKLSYHVYYCCFFRVAGGEYSEWQTDQGVAR